MKIYISKASQRKMVSKSVFLIFSLVVLVDVSFARHVFPIIGKFFKKYFTTIL